MAGQGGCGGLFVVLGCRLNDIFPSQYDQSGKALNWALKKNWKYIFSTVYTQGWPPLRIRNVTVCSARQLMTFSMCSGQITSTLNEVTFLVICWVHKIMRKTLRVSLTRQTIREMPLKIRHFFVCANFPNWLWILLVQKSILLNVPALPPFAIIIKIQSGPGQTHCPHLKAVYCGANSASIFIYSHHASIVSHAKCQRLSK